MHVSAVAAAHTQHLAAREQDGADPVVVLGLFEVHQHAGVQHAPELDPVLQSRAHLHGSWRGDSRGAAGQALSTPDSSTSRSLKKSCSIFFFSVLYCFRCS